VPSIEGDCPRLKWSDTPFPSVAFDLSALYPGVVSTLYRTISAGPAGLTRWRDDVSGLAAGRRYRFTWVTTAEVKIEEGGVVLSQGGRSLRITVKCAQPVEVYALDGAILLKPNDAPLPGLKRLEFAVVSTGAKFSVELEAVLVAS